MLDKEQVFNRELLLIGNDNFDKLQKSNVAVIGVGGVGGYVCEMLVRGGIGSIFICDFDKVDITNINRQIIALNTTIGQYKVDVMEDRLKSINPNVNLIKCNKKFDENLLKEIDFSKFDYIVDAIDDVKNKFELIKFAKNNNFNIVSALGAGNKYCIPNYVVSDIYKTEYDKLAKVIRQKCRLNKIKNLDVVYMKTDKVVPKVCESTASISYHPCILGATLASFVINKLIEK